MKNHFVTFRLDARIIFVLVFYSLVISKALAQEGEREYVPFVEEGKVWYCTYNSIISPITAEHPEGEGIDCIFAMCGDTLINGGEYKKVYCQYEYYYGDKERHYFCGVREDSYRVYIVEYGLTEEKIIYDFSSPEEYLTLFYNGYKFARTDGESRECYLPGQMDYLVCMYSGDEIDYSHSPSLWIEGVGDPYHNPFALEFNRLLYDEPKLGKSTYVRTCMKGNKYIYNMDWMAIHGQDLKVYWNYSEVSRIQSHLYDLQGRRLTSPPSHGVYIQGGRKLVR